MSEPTPREPEIALVLSADRWVDDLHRHCADHGGARVRSMVLDPAVALEEEFDVLVAGDRWPALTRPFVDGLHARGRRILVVGDETGAVELASRLGIDAVVTAASSPTEIVAAVVALVPAGRPTRVERVAEPDGEPACPALGSGPGDVIAVGGPFGAGATEIAIGLAAASARRGRRSVLVDADDVTPSIAARLGLPLEPNLCTAVDAVAYGLGAVPGALFDLGEGWPAVLVGAPNRRTAATLRAEDVLAVGDVLSARYSPVVFDVSAGGVSAGGGEIGPAVVRRASAVVAVGAANPVGVLRLLDWLRDMAPVPHETPIHVLVNRAPERRARRAQVAGEIQREVPTAGLTFAPGDARVEDAAWSASVVARGPFARAVDSLWSSVTADAASAGDRG